MSEQQQSPEVSIAINVGADGQLSVKIQPADLPLPMTLGLLDLAKFALTQRLAGAGSSPIVLAQAMPRIPNGGLARR